MSSTRKYRRFRQQIRHRARDEEMTRFSWLVGLLWVTEAVIVVWIIGGARPL